MVADQYRNHCSHGRNAPRQRALRVVMCVARTRACRLCVLACGGIKIVRARVSRRVRTRIRRDTNLRHDFFRCLNLIPL